MPHPDYLRMVLQRYKIWPGKNNRMSNAYMPKHSGAVKAENWYVKFWIFTASNISF